MTAGRRRHPLGGGASQRAPGTTGRLRRPVLVLGALVAGLLAMRAAAPFVAPPAAVQVTPATPVAPATRPVLLAEATGTSLYLGGDDGLLRVDVDRRSVRRVPLSRRAAGADNGLVARGGIVVAVRGGKAYATSGRPGRPAVPLGPASYALASARPGRVWLVEETGDPHRWFRAREVALGRTGSLVGGAIGGAAARGTLPLGQRPVAGAPGGLLVHVAGAVGGLAAWNPRTGRLERRLAARTPLTVVAARGQAVAWVERSALHLGDLATGRDRMVPPPPGTEGFAAPGMFSPDGRILAAVTSVGFSTRPGLALVDTAQASAVRVAGSDGALSDRCSPCLAWSPAGDWVFFSRIGPGLAIGAYRLGRAEAVTVPVDVPSSFPPSFATTRPE